VTAVGRDRLLVLVGHEASVPPAQVIASAADLAEIHFMVDSRSENFGDLLAVARDIAPATYADFSDLGACLEEARRTGVTAVMTFTDKLCPVAVWLDSALRNAPPREILWGRKHEQRRRLREAGLSRVRSARVEDGESLRRFAASVGFPLMVKPIDGAASRDAWLIGGEPDLDAFLAQFRPEEPGTSRRMFAEEFVTGEPIPPYLADYISVEVFRSSPRAAKGVGASAFVTDRLPVAWPCRETGLVLPTSLTAVQQRSAIATAERALDILDSHRGAFHVEMKPRASGPEIIEANGRLGGFIARLVKYGTGTDLLRHVLSCALGRAGELELRWDRCALVFLFQPPPAARRIVRAPSRAELRRLPGVIAVDRVEHAGVRLDWRNGTNRAVAWAWLAADNHGDLHRKLLGVAQFLGEKFEFADEHGLPVDDDRWIEKISTLPRTGVAR
jgi:biotin carboxylase